MILAEALGVGETEVIAFVGAGGKTTAMMRLAGELASQGNSVVVVTTTHIREPLLTDVRAILVELDESRLLDELPALLQRFRLVAAATGLAEPAADGYRKLQPVSPALPGLLARLPGVDYVLVEADGAKGRSLKAPAAHEPVVPPSTTLLVVLAGVDAIGAPLTDSMVHRPELVASLAGLGIGQPITPRAMASVLGDRMGGLKGKPSQARAVALINKVASPQDWQRGLAVAYQLADRPGFDRVILGSMPDRASPIKVVKPPSDTAAESRDRRVSAVILAAGASRRFGSCKQLATIGGEPLVAAVTRAVARSQAREVLVVVGSRAEAVTAALAGLPVTIVSNPDWQEGMGSSVRAGMAAVDPTSEGVLFVLADQARLTAAEIDATIDAFLVQAAAGKRSVVVPTHAGRRGNPVLFDRAYFPDLLGVEGEEGGRSVLARHPEALVEVAVPTAGVVTDVDTPADLAGLVDPG